MMAGIAAEFSYSFVCSFLSNPRGHEGNEIMTLTFVSTLSDQYSMHLDF